MNITCFKAYDIRGRIPDQLNEEVAYRIGRAYAQFLAPQQVVVGQDVRPTSPAHISARKRRRTVRYRPRRGSRRSAPR